MPQTKTTRLTVAPENVLFLEDLAQQWGVDNLSKALNYLLFLSRTQATVPSTQPATVSIAPTAQFVQIPAQELYREPVPGKFVPFEEIAPQAEEVSDPVIEKFLAIGLDSF